MKRTTLFALIVGALLATTAVTVSAQGTDPKARLQIAEKMFHERCKKAGEFIHRKAENVEGILLMKLRPIKTDFSNQFVLDDPYGDDTGGNGYISNFLSARTARGSISNGNDAVTNGYRYVEAIDPTDGKRYRYTGSMKVVGKKDVTAPNVRINLQQNPNYDLSIYAFVLDKVSAPGAPPRYGVTYDDISTREEREYWIAGSSLKVIDLKTSEVMAERIGYMMDRGQGNKSGGRSPWLLATHNACQKFPATSGGHPVQIHQTRYFVEKVLHIKQAKRDN